MAFRKGVVIEVDKEDRDQFRQFALRYAQRQGLPRTSAREAFHELVRIAKEWEREHAEPRRP